MTDRALAGQPVAWIEHHKGGDNLNWEPVDHPYAKATPLYRSPPSSLLEQAVEALESAHLAMRASWNGCRSVHGAEVDRVGATLTALRAHMKGQPK